MKIYTKTGDGGKTSLFSGERVEKNHPLVAAYGTVDECNSLLGAALACGPQEEVARRVTALQHFLFELSADLATSPGKRSIRRMSGEDVARLEKEMDALSELLPPLRAFILPGGTPAAAHLHVARAVIRRAEREAVAARATHPVNSDAIVALNRCSDYLFLLARRENQLAGSAETEWHAQPPPGG